MLAWTRELLTGWNNVTGQREPFPPPRQVAAHQRRQPGEVAVGVLIGTQPPDELSSGVDYIAPSAPPQDLSAHPRAGVFFKPSATTKSPAVKPGEFAPLPSG